MMEIIFTKKENGKHVLLCKRKDGTCTWMNTDEFFLRHDLLHYAVETVLKFKSAFYGMIAKGIAITDFDQPRNKRNIKFSNEALIAEHIVNLAMIEMREGLFNDFNNKLKESIVTSKQNLKDFYINNEQLELIRLTYSNLLKKWNNLVKDETITLKFSG